MTYRTVTRDHTAPAPGLHLARLLAELDGDDLVRPEFRNAAILGARQPVEAPRPAAPSSPTPAGRS